MKKLMFSLFVIAVSISLLAFTGTDVNPSDVVMLRGSIIVTKDKDFSCIKVFKGTENVEIIPLGRTFNGEEVDAAINKIIQTVNKYTSEGYEVISSTEVDVVTTVTQSVFNFILKKQDLK
jgi:hypothetical protein